MPPKIPPRSDDELDPKHRELLASLPTLNVFRMVAGAPRAARPFLALFITGVVLPVDGGQLTRVGG